MFANVSMSMKTINIANTCDLFGACCDFSHDATTPINCNKEDGTIVYEVKTRSTLMLLVLQAFAQSRTSEYNSLI